MILKTAVVCDTKLKIILHIYHTAIIIHAVLTKI